MARDGSGTYSLPEAPFVYNTVIDESAVNNNFSDIASALTASLAKDGQTNPSANLPMANFKHTGVGNASARDHYAATGQVQDSSFTWCGTAGGTANVLTLTPSPAITAYAAGQRFSFVASALNTSSVTVAVSGLAAKDIKLADGSDPYYGSIRSGGVYAIEYDGTNFCLTTPTSQSLNATYTTTGSGGTYVVTTGSGVTPYDGYFLSIEANHTNGSGGGVTINPDSTGAQSIVLCDGTSLYAGAMTSGGKYVLMHDGTRFQLLNPSPPSNTFYETTLSSAAATIDITGFDSSYKEVVIEFSGVKPVTDGRSFWLRIGTGAGPTWQSTAYVYAGRVSAPSGGATIGSGVGSSPTSAIEMNASQSSNLLSNSSSRAADGRIRIYNPAGATNAKNILWDIAFFQTANGGEPCHSDGNGIYGSNAAVTGLRLLMDSGNIAAGATVRAFGIR